MPASLTFMPMQMTDLDEVMSIETRVQSHPWTWGNFKDALEHEYDAWVVRSMENVILGFFVQMAVVDETHLLTIAVTKERQGQGIGMLLLQHATERARLMHMDAVSLEVRESNLRALSVYTVFGFLLVGRRKNYYPMHHVRAHEIEVNEQKPYEDALILRYPLT